MKKSLILLYLLITQSIFAQPVLTQSLLIPSIGDSYVLYDTDTSIQAAPDMLIILLIVRRCFDGHFRQLADCFLAVDIHPLFKAHRLTNNNQIC